MPIRPQIINYVNAFYKTSSLLLRNSNLQNQILKQRKQFSNLISIIGGRQNWLTLGRDEKYILILV